VTPPPIDDRAIWDLWLSQYQLPVVLASDQLGVFSVLDAAPLGVAELCSELGLSERSVLALTGALAAAGFIVTRENRFFLTDISRTYLLKGSDFYWLPMLRGAGYGQMTADVLMQVLRTDNLGSDDRISRRWEQGEMNADDARGSNMRMHSHSLPSAIGLAANCDFSSVRRLLDVAGGSGCFSIQLALRNPELRCTVAELPPVALDTRAYIERAGIGSRVDTYPFNMFNDVWPTGYDAVFFSNVFHDWDPRRRDDLAQRAFAALPIGGRVCLHEMLLHDTADGPLPAALFSVMMLGTRGKQFSLPELDDLLTRAGFVDTQATPSYGYYSLVSATKPA
jgi:acetylserotonin N-methyltransferase